jgi:hypothetical protein
MRYPLLCCWGSRVKKLVSCLRHARIDKGFLTCYEELQAYCITYFITSNILKKCPQHSLQPTNTLAWNTHIPLCNTKLIISRGKGWVYLVSCLYATPYPQVQCPAYTNSSSTVNYMQYTTNLSWLIRLCCFRLLNTSFCKRSILNEFEYLTLPASVLWPD